MKIRKGIQEKVIKKARKVIKTAKPRKTIRNKHWLVIEVDYRHRLLSLDNGTSWELMTHEAYNKMLTR